MAEKVNVDAAITKDTTNGKALNSYEAHANQIQGQILLGKALQLVWLLPKMRKPRQLHEKRASFMS